MAGPGPGPSSSGFSRRPGGRGACRAAERFLWCWAWVGLIVLSLPARKHHHYLVPIVTPWAILGALGLLPVGRLLLARETPGESPDAAPALAPAARPRAAGGDCACAPAGQDPWRRRVGGTARRHLGVLRLDVCWQPGPPQRRLACCGSGGGLRPARGGCSGSWPGERVPRDRRRGSVPGPGRGDGAAGPDGADQRGHRVVALSASSSGCTAGPDSCTTSVSSATAR